MVEIITAQPSPQSDMTAKSMLRVMTFNIGHAGRDGFSHLFQSTKRLRRNLDAIAAMLRREQADIVALQEVDGVSFWNGRFNHMQYLSRAAGFNHGVRGRHVHGLGLSYGTGLLSHLHLSEHRSVKFAPSPPTFPKGYVAACFDWPGRNRRVEVVSLHLDFLRPTVRGRQLDKLAEDLGKRDNPLIIMGDFNSTWAQGGSMLSHLVKRLELSVYHPEAPGHNTFPRTGKRLDWIFISPHLRFKRHLVLPDRLSDHLAVLAEVELPEGEN